MMKKKKSEQGFTLIEMLVVMGIIGILAVFIIANLQTARNKALLTRAKSDFRAIHQALIMYEDDHGDYPPDASRSVPPGLEKYLGSHGWPEGAWPGSVFDWDKWTDPDTGETIYQISLRFCPIGVPSECKFPKFDWAKDFDINSSVYYCLEGNCRAHIGKPIDHPGLCVNCP